MEFLCTDTCTPSVPIFNMTATLLSGIGGGFTILHSLIKLNKNIELLQSCSKIYN